MNNLNDFKKNVNTTGFNEETIERIKEGLFINFYETDNNNFLVASEIGNSFIDKNYKFIKKVSYHEVEYLLSIGKGKYDDPNMGLPDRNDLFNDLSLNTVAQYLGLRKEDAKVLADLTYLENVGYCTEADHTDRSFVADDEFIKALKQHIYNALINELNKSFQKYLEHKIFFYEEDLCIDFAPTEECNVLIDDIRVLNETKIPHFTYNGESYVICNLWENLEHTTLNIFINKLSISSDFDEDHGDFLKVDVTQLTLHKVK